MENLVKIVGSLVDGTKKSTIKNEQISKLDEIIKALGDDEGMKKPTYNFPQPDTLGIQTYSNLNRK